MIRSKNKKRKFKKLEDFWGEDSTNGLNQNFRKGNFELKIIFQQSSQDIKSKKPVNNRLNTLKQEILSELKLSEEINKHLSQPYIYGDFCKMRNYKGIEVKVALHQLERDGYIRKKYMFGHNYLFLTERGKCSFNLIL